jgi:hypothetical protein
VESFLMKVFLGRGREPMFLGLPSWVLGAPFPRVLVGFHRGNIGMKVPGFIGTGVVVGGVVGGVNSFGRNRDRVLLFPAFGFAVSAHPGDVRNG